MVSVYHLIVILARSFENIHLASRYSEIRQDDRPSGTVAHAFERLRSRAHTVATLVDVRDQLQSESELSTLQFAGLRGKRLPDFIWSS